MNTTILIKITKIMKNNDRTITESTYDINNNCNLLMLVVGGSLIVAYYKKSSTALITPPRGPATWKRVQQIHSLS
jgi:hypothetical protein